MKKKKILNCLELELNLKMIILDIEKYDSLSFF